MQSGKTTVTFASHAIRSVAALTTSALGGLQMTAPRSIQEALDKCLSNMTSPDQVLSLALAKAAKRLNLKLPEL